MVSWPRRGQETEMTAEVRQHAHEQNRARSNQWGQTVLQHGGGTDHSNRQFAAREQTHYRNDFTDAQRNKDRAARTTGIATLISSRRENLVRVLADGFDGRQMPLGQHPELRHGHELQAALTHTTDIRQQSATSNSYQ